MKKGYDSGMEANERDITPTEDGRPAEVREGREPQSAEEAQEDIPDEDTIENVGY